jgi:hypothetical protein
MAKTAQSSQCLTRCESIVLVACARPSLRACRMGSLQTGAAFSDRRKERGSSVKKPKKKKSISKSEMD